MDRCVSLRTAKTDDLRAVEALLEGAALPVAGVAEWLPQFVVAENEGRIVGVAGIELYGTSALLRSVAVEQDWRGSGVGRQLVDRLLSDAQARGVHGLVQPDDTRGGTRVAAERFGPFGGGARRVPVREGGGAGDHQQDQAGHGETEPAGTSRGRPAADRA